MLLVEVKRRSRFVGFGMQWRFRFNGAARDELNLGIGILTPRRRIYPPPEGLSAGVLSNRYTILFGLEYFTCLKTAKDKRDTGADNRDLDNTMGRSKA
jgi:hypothetical protein